MRQLIMNKNCGHLAAIYRNSAVERRFVQEKARKLVVWQKQVFSTKRLLWRHSEHCLVCERLVKAFTKHRAVFSSFFLKVPSMFVYRTLTPQTFLLVQAARRKDWKLVMVIRFLLLEIICCSHWRFLSFSFSMLCVQIATLSIETFLKVTIGYVSKLSINELPFRSSFLFESKPAIFCFSLSFPIEFFRIGNKN